MMDPPHCDKRVWEALVDRYLSVLKMFLVSFRFVLQGDFACVHAFRASNTQQGHMDFFKLAVWPLAGSGQLVVGPETRRSSRSNRVIF